MTLKKTILISIVFHLCFFSAALLLFEGGGKPAETEIVFISLAADVPLAVRAVAVPDKVQTVKKAAKPPVIVIKEQAISEAKAVDENIEDKALEEFLPLIKEPVTEALFADESIGDVKDQGEDMEAAEAVYDIPAYSGQVSVSAGHGDGLLPGVIEMISMAIEKVKRYPVLARKRGIEGTVHVSFNIMADGNPYGIKILKSSGFSILDKATVNVVKQAAPFPLIASRIELPVAYRLRN